MYDTDPTQTGALEGSHHDTETLEYQTQTFQQVALGDTVENATAIIEDARTVEGDEMRVSWEREQAIEQGLSRRPDERVAHDRQDMETAIIERINGEQAELERQYETAHRANAAEHDRAAANRDAVTADTYYDASTADETPDTDTLPSDPWPELTQEQVADINSASQQLADHFDGETAMDRSGFAGLLAKHVANGQDVTSALFETKETIQKLPTVRQPIADIDPFDQYETTVEGEITTLWTPEGDGQRQVGLIRDDSGEAVKLTVWQRAGDKPLLREGDTVRLGRTKVNAYKSGGEWTTTLAVDSEATIDRIERGDGPAPRRGQASDDPRMAPWDPDSDQHAWLTNSDADREPNAFLTTAQKQRANAYVRGELTPGGFIGLDD